MMKELERNVEAVGKMTGMEFEGYLVVIKYVEGGYITKEEARESYLDTFYESANKRYIKENK